MKLEENQELEPIDGLFLRNMRSNKIKNETDEIKKWEEKVERKELKHERHKYTYDFQQFETIRYFGDSAYTGKINIDENERDQSKPLKNMVKFNNKSKPKTKGGKDNKRNTFYSVNALYEGRELTLNAFKEEVLPIKATKGEGLKSYQ